VLRESSRVLNYTVNLEALAKPEQDIGVPGGAALLAFSNAVLGSDRAELDKARDALVAELGSAGLTAAAAIAANFTKNDRIANGLGIPSEPFMLKDTFEMREQLGINQYPSAVNTLKNWTDK
jgi:hypothetical protein